MIKTVQRVGFLVICASIALACEGMTLGENAPGQDTYLGFGALAVDHVTETVFVLQTTKSPTGKISRQELVRVDPAAMRADAVIDLTGLRDLRILFPSSGILVMAERNGKEQLILFDRHTFAEKTRIEVPTRYHGTRMSPSRRFVVVADNGNKQFPLNLIDTLTMDIHRIPHGQEWLEAMWAADQDILYVMAGPLLKGGGTMHLLSYNLDALLNGGFKLGSASFWAGENWHLKVENASADLFFSFSWVGVSPTGTHVAFPMLSHAAPTQPTTGGQAQPEPSHVVALVDTHNGSLSMIDDAYGPVGFTPDGATMVSYRHNMAQGRDLLLIDTATQGVIIETLPYDGGISFFVSHEDNLVVIAPVGTGGNLILHNADTGTQTTVYGPGANLHEFVSRPAHSELWIANNGLFRLDLRDAEITSISLGVAPNRINILTKSDLLVLRNSSEQRVVFYDPNDDHATAVPLQ